MSLLYRGTGGRLKRAYGYCGCGARITQNAKATVCIICSGFERQREQLERSHRAAVVSPVMPPLDYLHRKPRYMDGEVVE
jgi:hypothetical protein